jgi:hypothetical protein
VYRKEQARQSSIWPFFVGAKSIYKGDDTTGRNEILGFDFMLRGGCQGAAAGVKRVIHALDAAKGQHSALAGHKQRT